MRALCRCGCGERLQGRQKSWRHLHAGKCVREYELAKGYSKAIRRAVFERDHGICALCKIDAYSLEKSLFLYPGKLVNFRTTPRARINALDAAFARDREIMRSWAFAHGFPAGGKCFWEADHIVPVVEGGTHALENLRTLCVPCHKGQTKLLAGRRARARRGADTLELPLVQNCTKPPFPAAMAA